MDGVQDTLDRGVRRAVASDTPFAAPGLPLTSFAADRDSLAPALLAALAIHVAALGLLLLAALPARLPEIAETPAVSMVFEQATPAQPAPSDQQLATLPPVPPAEAEAVQPPDAPTPPDLAQAEPVPDIQAVTPLTPDPLPAPETLARPLALQLPQPARPVLRPVPALPAAPKRIQLEPARPRAPSQAMPVPMQARTEAGTPERSSPPPTQVAVASGPSMSAWRDALMAWLEKHKTYPEAAREQGTEGRALVRFTVSRDGRVIGADLARSSGSHALDEAALELVRAARLPPFPTGVPHDTMTATVPLTYQLE